MLSQLNYGLDLTASITAARFALNSGFRAVNTDTISVLLFCTCSRMVPSMKEFTSRDIRYTMNGEKLYATALREDENGEYSFTLLGEKDASRKANFHGIVKNVELLGYDGELEWHRDGEALHVKSGVTGTDKPVVFRITLD